MLLKGTNSVYFVGSIVKGDNSKGIDERLKASTANVLLKALLNVTAE